ncbi:MAG: helix-hairpin-helix domain-containing protein [Candidatus Delongbacteria bacterium]|nr:helix-hairpin-helix domain-containing protein [Candidatus Delongbacteria bacterium]
MKIIEKISHAFDLDIEIVKNIDRMLNENLTFHFILRYRKAETGDISETRLREVLDFFDKSEKLENRKAEIINLLIEKDLITEELKKKIELSETISDLEFIYSPFKAKKEANVQKALDYGFGSLVDKLIKYGTIPTQNLIEKYSDGYKCFDALLSSEIIKAPSSREFIKNAYQTYGQLSIVAKNKEDIENEKYKVYLDRVIHVRNIKAFQTLAINRGEKQDILKVNIVTDEINKERFLNYYKKVVENYSKAPVLDAYRRILKSVESEIRNNLTEAAEIESCEIFQRNLHSILTKAPIKNKKIFAIDPGYKNGCKYALLDEFGNPFKFGKFFISENKLNLPDKEEFDLIVLGNGTASKEAFKILSEHYKQEIFIVNEAGASVYSTSEEGIEEFPDLDPLDRGSVSIGRRFIDSMAELVKIPVQSLGVGMYQHDIKEAILDKKLSETIENVVNFSGVDVNSASASLLRFISGLDKRSAKKIAKNKPYKSRSDLKKVLSEKAFNLAAGFLRIPESKTSFDNTIIHPDHYEIAEKIQTFLSFGLDQDPKHLSEKLNCDHFTIDYIMKELKNPGISLLKRDGTTNSLKPVDKDDLHIGSIFNGIIRNIVPFGYYVDFGFKNDGLLHISSFKNRDEFSKYSAGDFIEVQIENINDDFTRINLKNRE